MKNKTLLVLSFSIFTCCQGMIDSIESRLERRETQEEKERPVWWDKELDELAAKSSSIHLSFPLCKLHGSDRWPNGKDLTTIETVCYHSDFSFAPIRGLIRHLRRKKFFEQPENSLVFLGDWKDGRRSQPRNLKTILRLFCKYPEQVVVSRNFLYALMSEKDIGKVEKNEALQRSFQAFNYRNNLCSIAFGSSETQALRKAVMFPNNKILLDKDLYKACHKFETSNKSGFYRYIKREQKIEKWDLKEHDKYFMPSHPVHDRTAIGFVLPFRYEKTEKSKPRIATRTMFRSLYNFPFLLCNSACQEITIEQKELEEEADKGKEERLQFVIKKIPILNLIFEDKQN